MWLGYIIRGMKYVGGKLDEKKKAFIERKRGIRGYYWWKWLKTYETCKEHKVSIKNTHTKSWFYGYLY